MATGLKMRTPPRPVGESGIVAFCQALWDKIYAGGLIGSTPTTRVASFKDGVYLLESDPKKGGGGAKIRLLLCDGITGGPPKYYLVTAELDPDQTPTP